MKSTNVKKISIVLCNKHVLQEEISRYQGIFIVMNIIFTFHYLFTNEIIMINTKLNNVISKLNK